MCGSSAPSPSPAAPSAIATTRRSAPPALPTLADKTPSFRGTWESAAFIQLLRNVILWGVGR
jgi:hypothetical protein